jgi:C4-dicarboxylate-binding protein DctP
MAVCTTAGNLELGGSMKSRIFMMVVALLMCDTFIFAGGEKEKVAPKVQGVTTQKAEAQVDRSQKYTMKYSWVDPYDPLKQATSSYALVFKTELEKLSGGQISVELYPAGQLADQRSSVEQVAKGTIEATNISSGVLASLYYDKLGIIDMPFLFSSRAHAAKFLSNTNPLIAKMAKECADKSGIKILSLFPFGPRYLTTSGKRQVKSPADMQGLKIRTMEIIPHMKLIESLGATPVPIPFLELYTSLQTNVVDGEENTLQNILTQKFYQVQKYLTMTNHVMGVAATLVNNKLFESFPDHLKKAVVEADINAQTAANGLGHIWDCLGMEELKKNGMEVYTPTPDEMQKFRDKAIPYVSDHMIKSFGKEFVTEFLTSVDKAREEVQSAAVK